MQDVQVIGSIFTSSARYVPPCSASPLACRIQSHCQVLLIRLYLLYQDSIRQSLEAVCVCVYVLWHITIMQSVHAAIGKWSWMRWKIISNYGRNPIVVVSFPDSHNPTRYTVSWRYVSLGMKLIYSNAFHGLKLSMKIVTKYHSRSLKYHTNSQQ